MKVVTAEQMREIDRVAIEEYGMPGLVLMERAGTAVASRVRELYPDKKITVLCGGGNNGGDGLVAARNLFNWGFNVQVLILARKDSLSPDCGKQYQIAKKTGVPIEFRKEINKRDTHGAVVVDAVFGTGLGRPVDKELARVFAFLNNSAVPVVAVDIPSGISSDTGEVLGEAIMAGYTVTFGLPKRGHFLYPGAEYCGRLFIEDIGFPAKLLTSEKISAALIDRETASVLIPLRQRASYKGDYGHILIIAGSRGKTGAALMTAGACLRSGAGLVTVGVPESLMDTFQSRVTEEMLLPLPDDGSGMLASEAADAILDFICQKADVIAIGPGIGVSSHTEKIVAGLVLKSTVPMVIDADGINSLSPPHPPLGKGGSRGGISKSPMDILRKAKAPVILTPHPGEMARLLNGSGVKGQGSKEIEKDRIITAVSFAKETGTYVVLKGVPTVVATPEGKAFLNTTGNPGMATAGSGDVLTGIIASLLGQGLEPLSASLLGVYLHGLAGDRAASCKGEHSLIASDIIDLLPQAFMEVH